MSVYVLLILLNQLGERDKIRNNDTKARMLVSFYLMTLKILKRCIFVSKRQDFRLFYATL